MRLAGTKHRAHSIFRLKPEATGLAADLGGIGVTRQVNASPFVIRDAICDLDTNQKSRITNGWALRHEARTSWSFYEGVKVAVAIGGGTPMREPQVRLTNISKEIDRGNTRDVVGNPTGVSELAACLFDLRTAHEAELRTLTWIQKTLEGLRTGRECSDADLLLREMARLIRESEGTAASIAGHRRFAVELLSAVIADAGCSAREPKPLAIVAA